MVLKLILMMILYAIFFKKENIISSKQLPLNRSSTMSNRSGPKFFPFPVAQISSFNYNFSSSPLGRSSRLEKDLIFSVISSLFLSRTHSWDQDRKKMKKLNILDCHMLRS